MLLNYTNITDKKLKTSEPLIRLKQKSRLSVLKWHAFPDGGSRTDEIKGI